MVSPNIPTKDAVKSIQNFINSCGRFGSTPFLYTLYGSGEMPQAFCRLCAVFGGIYCLNKNVASFIINANGECKGIVMNGKRINSPLCITNYAASPEEFQPNQKLLSRAILISDTSIKLSEKENISFLRLQIDENIRTPINILETGASSLVTPKGLCKFSTLSNISNDT